jgi:hypothetical protein
MKRILGSREEGSSEVQPKSPAVSVHPDIFIKARRFMGGFLEFFTEIHGLAQYQTTDFIGDPAAIIL